MNTTTRTALFGLCLAALPVMATAQSLASNNTRAQARYNKEKIFAEAQRKLFTITSWAGANINDLLAKWGTYTRKSELPNGVSVYIFENRFSGSGGSYTPGYVVTDQSGNVVAQKQARDNTFSYDFTEYYEFYSDRTRRIIHVKTGTR
ncbi:MAG: hypothetical protein J0M10_14015 [Chitinophagales bacterium]|nr:hypothetical protein [Chitinophagales bacterium]